MYLRLPMGISGAPDIFQEKMINLMRTLEYVHTCINDVLVITRFMYDDHLDNVGAVLDCLRLITSRVDAKKSIFALHEIEYLGYVLSRDDIKLQPEKVSAILALRKPQNVKELLRVLAMVQST